MTRIYGFAQQGGVAAETDSLLSDNLFQESFPGATVTVYLTGTLTLATIYADDISTPLANPFTADSATAYFFFYAQAGVYDIKFSGAGIVTPFTLGGVDCPTNWVPPITLTSATGVTLTVSQTGGGTALAIVGGDFLFETPTNQTLLSISDSAGALSINGYNSGNANHIGIHTGGAGAPRIDVDNATDIATIEPGSIGSTDIASGDSSSLGPFTLGFLHGATQVVTIGQGAGAGNIVMINTANARVIGIHTGGAGSPRIDLENGTDTTTIQANAITIAGTLFATGLDITGDSAVSGQMHSDSLVVDAQASVGGNLGVTGVTNTDSLTVTAAAAVGGNLGVTGQTTTDSLVVTAGASIHALTLGTGGLTITGNLAVSGQTHTDTLVVDSVASINSLTIGAGGLNVAGNLAVAGQMHSDSLQVDANGAILALTVTDLSVINGAGDGKITIKGTTGIEVDCYTGSTLEAIWSAGATSAFTVTTNSSATAFVVLQTGVVEAPLGTPLATETWVLAQIAALAAAHGTYSVAGGGGGTVTI